MDRLYVHAEDLDAALAFLNSNLLVLMENPLVLQKGSMALFFEHLHLTIRRLATMKLAGVDIGQANRQVDWIIGRLEEGILPHTLLWDSLLQDYNMYHHAVNVFLIALAFMHFLSEGPAACRIVGIACSFMTSALRK